MFNRSMSSRSSIYGDSNMFNSEKQDISNYSQESFDSWAIDQNNQYDNHIDQDSQAYNQHNHDIYRDTEDQVSTNTQSSYHNDWTKISMLGFHMTPAFTSPYYIKPSKTFKLDKEFLRKDFYSEINQEKRKWFFAQFNIKHR